MPDELQWKEWRRRASLPAGSMSGPERDVKNFFGKLFRKSILQKIVPITHPQTFPQARRRLYGKSFKNPTQRLENRGTEEARGLVRARIFFQAVGREAVQGFLLDPRLTTAVKAARVTRSTASALAYKGSWLR